MCEVALPHLVMMIAGLTFDLILRLGAADEIRILDYGKASFEN